MGRCLFCKQEMAGSIPVWSTDLRKRHLAVHSLIHREQMLKESAKRLRTSTQKRGQIWNHRSGGMAYAEDSESSEEIHTGSNPVYGLASFSKSGSSAAYVRGGSVWAGSLRGLSAGLKNLRMSVRYRLSPLISGCGQIWMKAPDLGSGNVQVRILSPGRKCGRSSTGRTPACQVGGCEIVARRSLLVELSAKRY